MKKRIMASLLAISIMILPLGALAADLTEGQEILQAQLISAPISEELDMSKPFYRGVTIKVTAIDDYLEGTDWKIILGEDIVSSTYEAEARIIISPNTFVLDNVEIKVGDIITGFFDATRPMIMIYPPQYSCDVVVVVSDKNNVDFDIFDEDLVSRDNFLKLNLSDETEIVTVDEKAYTGELTGRKLVVLFGASTRSIPAQTKPQKIIVLPEVSEKGIVVNNKVITAPPAYDNGQGVTMVPLRAIAEALGYEVKWNDQEQTIRIGEKFTLKIGEEIAPLEIAPALQNGLTYVSLHFFMEAMGVVEAAGWTGRIVINN